MGFHTLKFAHLDCCYSGRLKLEGNRLVEGPDDETGIALDVPNDMVLALGIAGDIDSFYQGWYDNSSDGLLSTFYKFNKTEWYELGEGYKFHPALRDAMDEVKWEMDRYTERYPTKDLRLFGRGLYFYTGKIE